MTAPSTHAVFGRWTVLSDLGQGGQGKTFLVRDADSDTPRVLKLLSLDAIERWSAVERFAREVDVLRSLDHPQIPRWVDAFEDLERGHSCLVQDYVDGQTLDTLRRQGPLDPRRLEALLRSALEPLHYLHGRVPPVIHRDLSPRNLIVSNERVHLVDFGAVKAVGGDGGSVTAVGTFGYMPLEQARGEALPASDIYALGMSFLCLAASVEPHALPLSPRTGRVDMARALEGRGYSPRLIAAMTAMTEPGLAARAPSVESVIALLDGLDTTTPHTARRPAIRALLTLCLLIATLALVLLLLPPSLDPRERMRLGGQFSGHSPLLGGTNYIYGATFSPDGTRLGSFDSHQIFLWNLETGESIADFSRDAGEFRGAFFGAFSGDGTQFLASTSEASSLFRDGVHTSLEVANHAWRHAGRPLKSPTLRALGATAASSWHLAFEVWGDTLTIIDPLSGSKVWGTALDGDYNVKADFNADGTLLAFATGLSRSVRVVELATQREVYRTTLSGHADTSALAFSPMGDRIAIATASDVTLIDLGTRLTRTFAAPFGKDSSRLLGDRPLTFSRDGTRLAVGFDDGFRIHDTNSGEALDRVPVTTRINSLALSPDGKTAAVTGDETIHLFDLTTPEAPP